MLKPAIKKPKLLRSNPSRFVLLYVEDNDDGYWIDDEGIYVGYRRPNVVKSDLDKDDDEELSDYVKLRLLKARVKAVEAYKKAWAQKA